uniref:Uncharacterized protein n=1 Tax=Oryza glumipatula TaxID=40148 RepID=A0A0E0AH55_9ORYZ
MTNVEGSKADEGGDEVGEEGHARSLCSIVADVKEPEADDIDNDGIEAGRAQGDGVAEDSNEVSGESDDENNGGDNEGVLTTEAGECVRDAEVLDIGGR